MTVEAITYTSITFLDVLQIDCSYFVTCKTTCSWSLEREDEHNKLSSLSPSIPLRIWVTGQSYNS